MVVGLLTILLRFPRLSPEQREIRVQVWSRTMLVRLGIRLQVQGDATLSGPLLLVANHISWLDITSLHAARFCRFVSKADVQAWPVIGALASGVGTLFIQRESRRDAMRVVHHMAERLRAGDVLAVFPEGTTSDGVDLLPFHANLLQAAIAAGVPVQPVALQFIDTHSGERSLAPCYVGDDTLLGSIWRTVRARGITVCIVFGAPQAAQGRERRAWAHALREDVISLRAQAPR
ncbi:MAG: lysophospholipid acyltransferase family protein [Hylemonella sp.]|nr:lysophospholipid acyltransferase family protein [Hylemonella sp.]